ncbi:hypothetical protein ElyMa_003042600 [Elysia marginata]|uniref:G-protein coupled receptors family 1 profile domain-containing protein n=1 Tax=Elysia marginata TaxID=1093978 RepID=A0AAV4II48_9GAST|nr:hypothetical protein ElyMa_003042600 [Elysia marginata]
MIRMQRAGGDSEEEKRKMEEETKMARMVTIQNVAAFAIACGIIRASDTAAHRRPIKRCSAPPIVFSNAICLVSFTASSPYTYTAISMVNAESRIRPYFAIGCHLMRHVPGPIAYVGVGDAGSGFGRCMGD